MVKPKVNDCDGRYTELRCTFPRYLFYEGISLPRTFTSCGGKCFTTNESLLRGGKAECEWDRRVRKREKEIRNRVNECELGLLWPPSDISVIVNLAHGAIRHEVYLYFHLRVYAEHNRDS